MLNLLRRWFIKKKENSSIKIPISLFSLMVFIFGYTILVHLYRIQGESAYGLTLREVLDLTCVFCILFSYFYATKSFFVSCGKDKHRILENAIVLLLVAVFLFSLSHFLIFIKDDFKHIDCNPFSFILFLLWVFICLCFQWIKQDLMKSETDV